MEYFHLIAEWKWYLDDTVRAQYKGRILEEIYKLIYRLHNLGIGTDTAAAFRVNRNQSPSPEAIKLFFMLNSTEHKIFPAHKC